MHLPPTHHTRLGKSRLPPWGLPVPLVRYRPAHQVLPGSLPVLLIQFRLVLQGLPVLLRVQPVLVSLVVQLDLLALGGLE